MSDKEFTLQEVTGHNTKKDLYIVIHDKVYDCSSFVDEHPYVSSIALYYFPRHILAMGRFLSRSFAPANTQVDHTAVLSAILPA